MDIIRSRQEIKNSKIDKIIESIRQAIYTDKKLEKEKIILAAMANLDLSRRTAREYLDIALYKSGIEIDKVNGNLKKEEQLDLNTKSNREIIKVTLEQLTGLVPREEEIDEYLRMFKDSRMKIWEYGTIIRKRRGDLRDDRRT